MIDIAAHEIIHGLGFHSTFINYKTVYGRSIDYLGPSLLSIGTLTLIKPISIFDSLLYSNVKSFQELSDTVRILEYQDLSKLEFLERMEADKDIIDSARELHAMATSGNVQLKLNDGQELELYSPSIFDIKSSLSHLPKTIVDLPLQNHAAEHLMMHVGAEESTLDLLSESLRSQNITTNGILGPKTVQLLEQMGYSTRNHPGQGFFVLGMF